MNNVEKLIVPAIASLIVACGSPFAGTGQQGEAKIMGIAVTSTGTVAANQSLTIAPAAFIAEKESIVSRAIVEKKVVVTDANGVFSIAIQPGQAVTISGRNGNDFIYLPGVIIESGDKNLGSVRFEPGVEVKLYPWWNTDGESDRFTVKGTDLGYVIPDTAVTAIWVPRKAIDLIHYDQSGSVSIPFNGEGSSVGSLGDSARWDSSGVKDTVIFVPKEALVNEPIALKLPAQITDGFHIAKINWGDSSLEEKVQEPKVQHKYSKAGQYAVSIEMLKLNSNTGFYETVRMNKFFITITESGKEDPNTNDSTIVGPKGTN